MRENHGWDSYTEKAASEIVYNALSAAPAGAYNVEQLGQYVDYDFLSLKILRGLAACYPSKFDTCFTHGLQEFRIK